MKRILRIRKIIKSERELILYEWHYWNTLISVLIFLITLNLFLTGSLFSFLYSLKSYGYIGSYFAGLLFADVMTVSFSIAIFFSLSREGLNPFLLSFIGALGAMATDYLIFNFTKNKSGKSIKIHNKVYRIPKIRSKFFRKISPILAGIIFASPFPDEFASILFGFEKYDVRKYLLLSFVFNFFGILFITWLGIVF